MSGIVHLATLLRSMSPKVLEGEFVFLSFANCTYGAHAHLAPIGGFIEAEGLTLIVPRVQADSHQLSYDGVFCCISLHVHSSLSAVGLTAAVADALTVENISANVVAAYYHDHVFVPAQRTQDALAALQRLSQNPN